MPAFPKLQAKNMTAEHMNVRKELKSRISGYVVGAFGLVAALAWNDAITSLINEIFPEISTTLLAKFTYAGIMTIVVAVVALYVVRLLAEKKTE